MAAVFPGESVAKAPACSEAMESYLRSLQAEADRCYEIASRARRRGFDPELHVEVPRAEDLATRVEELLVDWDVQGVASRIRELSRHHDREETSLLLAREMARRPARSKEEAVDRAIRVGLALLTEGILVAPLEGIAGVKIGKNPDGSDFLAVSYAGPIRSAGGTGQALSVLIADVVRRELGIGRYLPTTGEVQRLKEEIPLYKMVQHLQYTPANEEIELIARNVPVFITGEGTEEMEISGYRDQPRIETNRLRGGACLVIAEGLCLKAPKLQKHVKRLKIDGWEFLDTFLQRRQSLEAEEGEARIEPSSKFLKDIVAGRPVLAHPSRPGGFRLRYGRSRAAGLAALALHPATMHLLDEFVAVGTQLKIERPGKATAITPCDRIDGPIVLLEGGDLVQVRTLEEARQLRSQVAEIVDVGEILVPFGEFLENNHLLMPGAYSLEWHEQELRAALPELPVDWRDPSFTRAIELSRAHNVPLHPKFNLFWADLSMEEIRDLRSWVLQHGEGPAELRLPADPPYKRLLETLGSPHRVRDGAVLLEESAVDPLLLGLGLKRHGEKIRVAAELPEPFPADALQLVSRLAGVPIRARAVTRIGARMARPEKARERRMKPPPHVLFPLGPRGGPQRLVTEAAKAEEIQVELGMRACPKCRRVAFLPRCECGAHTVVSDVPSLQRIPLRHILEEAAARLDEPWPEEMKGVYGMISETKTPEALEKGILRAKHGVFVFKDGTIRFDMTDVPLTHFRPREIGLSVGEARALGYVRDWKGEPLKRDDQLCELKAQDVIPSASCGEYFVRVAKFIDELLERHYGEEPFYRAESPRDLIGQLVVGLAPHTSGGVLCRIIGYSQAQAEYAHPYFHAAKRRNCDGDEDSMILLMDCLLNFSRAFLPESRGGLMDAPLVLTTRLDPAEIDKEAHNLDVVSAYPLEFYQAALRYAQPRELEAQMDLVGARIGTVLQYEGLGFTHDTTDIAAAPLTSAYTAFERIDEMMDAQFALASKIRAVDVEDVVHRVITRHLLPDLIGGLRSFSGQALRCAKCGAKYRRIPLRGRCYCGNSLTLTVHEGSVTKYLSKSKEIGEKYHLPRYTMQRIELVENAIKSLFESDRVRKSKLEDFLGGD